MSCKRLFKLIFRIFSTNFNNCTIEGYFVGEFKKPEVEPLYKKDGTVKNQIIDQSVFYQMLIKSTRDYYGNRCVPILIERSQNITKVFVMGLIHNLSFAFSLWRKKMKIPRDDTQFCTAFPKYLRSLWSIWFYMPQSNYYKINCDQNFWTSCMTIPMVNH